MIGRMNSMEVQPYTEDEKGEFIPEIGKIYISQRGYHYCCIAESFPGVYTFISMVGWIFHTVGLRMNEDCRIEWDYSFGGRFENDVIGV